MHLRPCGDVLLVEPNDPEPEVVEFALDDAEAREEEKLRAGFAFAVRVDSAEMEHALDRYAELVGNLFTRFDGEEGGSRGARAGALAGAAMKGSVGII